MAQSSGIPITILPESDLQHFRLLELPAELLALVTSESPPLLQLKSVDNIDGTAKDANAVLCTPDKTFEIRQVNTSNSVYLTQPCRTGDDEGGSSDAIEAIAKCDSTLELTPASKRSAVPFIKKALPVFASTGSYGSARSVSKTELFSHIPLSQAECEEGWKELACFESIDPSGCFIPSAKVKAQVWEAAMTAATAERASLQDPFIVDDIPVFAMDLKEDWPLELLSGVFASVSSSTAGGNLAIDEERCVRFAGLSQLEARSGGRATDLAAFLKAWKDVVPETWRTKCEISTLKGSYNLSDGGKSITFIDSQTTANTSNGGAEEAKSALGAKRKWHEKFKSAKRTA
ncbi:hypothetical protein PRZ48_014426 [Zasmidium cellare]|uniref:Sister chromatid cohesion protein Dcc1 n=1 Tax=Zasmidium cellare TaxID=395010 RepID=A0ABR0DYY6_ZASCE|nr:hypothetical protein PRZ48_014426 [Zasmidium cellare]